MIEDGGTVRRHPVIGKGEGRGEIGGAVFGGAVDAGLERIALAAAHPLRQVPLGAAAGQGEAEHGVGGVVIIEARGTANSARRQIMAADDGQIPCRAVATTIGTGPRRPARLIDRRQRRSRLLEHGAISERDLGWHGLALGRKAERRWPRFAVAAKRRIVGAARRIVGAASPATAIDESRQSSLVKTKTTSNL